MRFTLGLDKKNKTIKKNTKKIKHNKVKGIVSFILILSVYINSNMIAYADFSDLINGNGLSANIEYNVPPPEKVMYNISQAQLTKQYTLPDLFEMDDTNSYVTFSYGDLYFNKCGVKKCDGLECLAIGHSHDYCDSTGGSITDDRMKVAIENITTNIGLFASGQSLYNQRQPLVETYASSSDAGSFDINILNYSFMLYRGLDIPTISKYSLSLNNKNEQDLLQLKQLIGMDTGYKPTGTRNKSLSYTQPLMITINKGSYNGVDYTTTRASGCSHRNSKSRTASITNGGIFSRTIRTGVYTSYSVNTAEHKAKNNITNLSLMGKNLRGVEGISISRNSSEAFKFYPWVRMFYHEYVDNNSVKYNVKTVDILGEKERSFIPIDYAEVGYYKSNDINLNIKSNQWSTHTSAINKKGENSVLPGGANYTLDTDGITTEMFLTTWQFIIPDGLNKEALKESMGSEVEKYKLSDALTNHSDFVKSSLQNLEDYRIVLWVNKDSNTKDITNGGTPIIDSNTDISKLNNGSSKLSQDSKYQLEQGTINNKASEGDIDAKEEVTNTIYWKVYSKVDGTVWLDCNSNLSVLQNSQSGKKILNQNELISDLKDADAILIDERTRLITNYVASIKRNQGYDNSTDINWVQNGRWYNEAFEIYLVQQFTPIRLALKVPSTRTSIINPKLCPFISSKSDVLNKFHSAQFKLSSESDTGIGLHIIGEFKGKSIKMNNIENMFTSKIFYIPNQTVQDTSNN